MLNLEYRLFTTNNSGAWISASGEVSDGFQKLEFEATHNEYQDIDVSSSNSFEITGNFLNFVKEWLLFDANKSTNSIECRIYYEDVDCNGYFNHYAYIRSNDIQPFNVKYNTDLIINECLEVRMKFERLKKRQLLTNTIDTDKRQNPNLTNGHVDFTLAYSHPQIHYQIDKSDGYFWAIILFLAPMLWVAVFAAAAGATIIFLPLAAAAIAAVLSAYALLLGIVGIDDYFIRTRGSQYSVLSPFHRDYINNISLTNGLAGYTDNIFTTPAKLSEIRNATFFYTMGLLHESIPNVEWDRLNMSNEVYLKWVNDRFNAKWRLIGNELFILPKSEDYAAPVVDLRFEDFEFDFNLEVPPASALYRTKEDLSDTKSQIANSWYDDAVTFTNGETIAGQKGTLEMNYLDASASFRNNGFERNEYDIIDGIYNALISFPVLGTIASFITSDIATLFQIGKDDGWYVFASSRSLSAPKLVVVRDDDNTRAVSKPYTAMELAIGVNKGYNYGYMQAGENFNYVVPCDKDLNNETQNLFSLQNDDPRITKEEGVRTYSSIGICCQKLKELGLLSVAGATPDIAIDYPCIIMGINGTEQVAEIIKMRFNFGTNEIELEVKKKNETN